MFSVLRWSLVHVRFVICGNLTDDGTHWPLCVRVGTNLADSVSPEIPEVRRLPGTTSAGTRHHTLGMSSVSVDAAATSRLPSEVKAIWHHDSSDVQAKSSFRSYLTSRAEVGENKKWGGEGKNIGRETGIDRNNYMDRGSWQSSSLKTKYLKWNHRNCVRS